MMERPEHLPDYTHPPLNEVVLGVQFTPVPGYSTVNAQGVWDLFRYDFPTVQEQPLLSPVFETFGGTNLQPSFQFEIGGAPMGNRLWFIAPGNDNLIQFQSDRFLVNWRKQSSSHRYPRFEAIAKAFERNLSILEKHLLKHFKYQILVNQAEISYINLIPVNDFSEVGLWISLWNGDRFGVESLNLNFRDIVRSDDGQPIARLHHELQSVFTVDGKHKALRLTITVRGKPSDGDPKSALDFLATGREVIVQRFTLITTPHAHKTWGRKS